MKSNKEIQNNFWNGDRLDTNSVIYMYCILQAPPQSALFLKNLSFSFYYMYKAILIQSVMQLIMAHECHYIQIVQNKPTITPSENYM